MHKAMFVYSLVTMGASEETLVRKHQNPGQLATDGIAQISDSFVQPTSKVSPFLIRDARQENAVELGADGSVEVGGHVVESAHKLSPHVVRDVKQQKTVEVGADGTVKIRKATEWQLSADGIIEVSDALVGSAPNFVRKSKEVERMEGEARQQPDTVTEPELVAAASEAIVEPEAEEQNLDELEAELELIMTGDLNLTSDTKKMVVGTANRNVTVEFESSAKPEFSAPDAKFRKYPWPTKLWESRGALKQHLGTLLQKSAGHIENFYFFRKGHLAYMCFFSMVVGCLAAAVFTRVDDIRTLVVRARNSVSESWGKHPPCRSNLHIDSDGEIGSSDEDDSPYLHNIRTDSKASRALKTGLLWKLERRFVQDLRKHGGFEFEPTDRFAYLENWDLRFFSLVEEKGAVWCSYVSQLNEFTSVTLEIKAIESRILKIPCFKPETARANKATRGAIIELYGDYLEQLRQSGFEAPESGTKDPENLFVFIVSGVRQGEADGSRQLGRLKFMTQRTGTPRANHLFRPSDTLERTSTQSTQSCGSFAGADEGAGLSHLCLAAAHYKICKCWHGEISNLLRDRQKSNRHLSIDKCDPLNRQSS